MATGDLAVIGQDETHGVVDIDMEKSKVLNTSIRNPNFLFLGQCLDITLTVTF